MTTTNEKIAEINKTLIEMKKTLDIVHSLLEKLYEAAKRQDPLIDKENFIFTSYGSSSKKSSMISSKSVPSFDVDILT